MATSGLATLGSRGLQDVFLESKVRWRLVIVVFIKLTD